MGRSAEGRESSGRRQSGRFDILEQLNAVARPRLTGSAGAQRVTDHVRTTLVAFGYDVRDLPFRFSPWPGRFGVTLLGGWYLAAAVGAGRLLWLGNGYGAMGVLAGVLLLTVLAITVGRRFLDRARWALRDGLNLLALPTRSAPKYLIVAHRDSKSQPVPLSVRGPAIALALITWVLLLLLAILSLAQPVSRIITVAATALAAVAGLTLLFCWVGNTSPGALDNASGTVAALGIAYDQRHSGDVAVLLTDAEELGLAGAKAIARRLPTVIGGIKVDGIDDAGAFFVVERFGWPRKRGQAPHLAAALLRAGYDLRLDVRRRDVPFGFMLDHIPIVVGGTPALTLMRGSTRSLQRVHRPSDDLANLRGQGIAPAIRLIAGALDLLRAQEPAARATAIG